MSERFIVVEIDGCIGIVDTSVALTLNFVDSSHLQNSTSCVQFEEGVVCSGEMVLPDVSRDRFVSYALEYNQDDTRAKKSSLSLLTQIVDQAYNNSTITKGVYDKICKDLADVKTYVEDIDKAIEDGDEYDDDLRWLYDLMSHFVNND